MLVNIILYLLQIIQYLYQQNCWLINFICKYIPLKQWAFDDSHSPKYQKLKTDELPKIIYRKQDWQWQDLIKYYELRYLTLSSAYIESSALWLAHRPDFLTKLAESNQMIFISLSYENMRMILNFQVFRGV